MSFLRVMALGAIIATSIVSSGLAAETKDGPVPVTDPAAVEQNYHQVLARPEYHEPVTSDLDSRLKEILSEWFTHLGMKLGDFKYAKEMPAFVTLLMMLLVVLSITGLFYVGVRLMRRKREYAFESAHQLATQKAFRPPEVYEEELRAAIARSDWHDAWLATWRQFLSRLEIRHLVEADRTRTNREYLDQLRAQNMPAPVLGLLTEMVDAYDRFIYGRKEIGQSDWQAFHQKVGEAGLALHLESGPRATAIMTGGS